MTTAEFQSLQVGDMIFKSDKPTRIWEVSLISETSADKPFIEAWTDTIPMPTVIYQTAAERWIKVEANS